MAKFMWGKSFINDSDHDIKDGMDRTHIACMGEITDVYKLLTVNSQGKIPLGKPKHRW